MQPKDIIKDAAVRIIAEEGFYSCTTDKIASEAGYSVGTIYNYFRNKEDILNYIFETERQDMSKLFKQLESKDTPVPEIIRGFFEKYYQRILNNVKLGKIILDESNRLTRGLNDEILDFLLLINNFFKDLINRGIKEGTVKDTIDPGIMAAAIMGASSSVVLQGLLHLEDLEGICQKAPQQLYQIFLEGIFVKNS